MAFIAVRRSADGSEETLGVVRAIADPDNVEAEFAIIVRSDLKGRGLGHLLLAKMIALPRRRAAPQRVVGYVLRENLAMRDLALSAGFVVDKAGSDVDAIRVVLALNRRPRRADPAAPRPLSAPSGPARRAWPAIERVTPPNTRSRRRLWP